MSDHIHECSPYPPGGQPVVFDPAWRTETVRLLAEGIEAERAFDRMPILADALEEAGCDLPEVLNHCRYCSTHTWGCWVVTLALGRLQDPRRDRQLMQRLEEEAQRRLEEAYRASWGRPPFGPTLLDRINRYVSWAVGGIVVAAAGLFTLNAIHPPPVSLLPPKPHPFRLSSTVDSQKAVKGGEPFPPRTRPEAPE